MGSSPPFLRIALRGLGRNARHSVGTLLAIAVGFLALVLVDGYLGYIERDLMDDMGERLLAKDVIVERPGAADLRQSARPFEEAELGDREQAFLRAWFSARGEAVVSAVPFLWVWGSATSGKASAPFYGLAYDVEAGRRLRPRFAWDAVAGRPLHRAGPGDVVLGRGMGARLDCEQEGRPRAFGKDGLPIEEERPFRCRRSRVQLVASTAAGQLNAVDAEVVGLIDGGLIEFDSKYVNLPLPLAQRLLDTQAISGFVVRLSDPSTAAAFCRQLMEGARAAGLPLAAYPWIEAPNAEESRRSLQVLAVYRVLVAAVVVLIAAMSVLTTMAKAVAERTREIGTLRSVGFLRRHVVAMFAMEAAMLAVAGAVIGAVLAVAITMLVNGAAISYDTGLSSMPMPLRIALRPGIYLASAAFLALLAALAGILPARRAARAPIHDALTHV